MAEAAAFRILDAAWALGIRAFDTAEAYGVSAARLRGWSEARRNADRLEVITKCSVGDGRSAAALEECGDVALARFEGTRKLTLLSHGAVGPDAWTGLLAASARHGAAAGQSVYSADEVRAACDLAGVDRIQVPGNVLDNRAMDARGNTSVPLDIRSVYLQGLLLEKPGDADARVPGSGRIVEAIGTAAAALEVALAPLLVASMLAALGRSDRLAIGVDSEADLSVLPTAFEIPGDTVREFESRIRGTAEEAREGEMLDPRQWHKQG